MALSNAIRNTSTKRLTAAMAVAMGLLGLQAHAHAAVLPVTSCADDGSAGTLRQVAATAVTGDTIDLSGLSCSSITLSAGEIAIPVSATLNGPASGTLTIVASSSRVLNSTAGTEAYLNIQHLNLSGGRMVTESGNVEGGCVRADGTLRLTNSNVSNCTAGSSGVVRGGAVYATAVELVSSHITGNSAGAEGQFNLARGGGVYAYQLSCVDSTLSGNSATAGAGVNYSQGGGVAVTGGNVALNRCTVDTNYAGSGAGIMQFARGADMTIQNSTISSNIAESAYGSAGVQVFCADCSTSTVHLLNSTIAFNSAPTNYGAGISSNGLIDSQSTIIASNIGNQGGIADLYAKDLSGADNTVTSTNVTPAAGVITVTADPQLLPLADNGGATRTHALATASPAAQMGNNTSGFATDQRGLSRTFQGTVDVGAFQTQTAEPQRSVNDPIFSGTFNS